MIVTFLWWLWLMKDGCGGRGGGVVAVFLWWSGG